MHGWDGMGWFGWLLMTLFWILVLIGIFYLVRAFTVRSGTKDWDEKSSLESLRKRYARGEISPEEYEQKKNDLE